MKPFIAGLFLIPFCLAISLVAQEQANPAQASANAQDSQTKATSQSKSAAKDESRAPSRYHLRLGTVSLSAGYVSGPWWYPYGPYGYYPYYASAFWDPFWGPFGPYSYYPADLTYGNGKGQIDLKADPKTAEVYIDGAYAGTVQHLKSFWLDPGAYDVSISAAGREPFHQRIYVLTGKTLSISAKLTPPLGAEEKQQ